MLAKTIATLTFALLASSATAFPQSATPAPQIQDLGNGCFSVTFKSGGSSSSSRVCGPPGSGAPQITDQGNGCFSVVLGGSTSSVCASSSGGSPSSSTVIRPFSATGNNAVNRISHDTNSSPASVRHGSSNNRA
ncbi:hypothetical protein BKA69DRAFT_1126486 [Paraphysoderma sedebokerense]|nr:hypothetical protein BKA69DRAFT_630637 [Paraphysoderma sedebokerense]KAI9139539.1 hypothetical protein BKA69DRAFT_1126486 [Paraphysoderma sedebokerense]